LIEELAEEEFAKKGMSTEQESSQYRYAKDWIKHDKTRFRGNHYPISTESKQANRHNERHKCIVCARQVTTMCEQCHVGLCCTLLSNNMSCFKKFHTDVDFLA
jgi:hypothetical protein